MAVCVSVDKCEQTLKESVRADISPAALPAAMHERLAACKLVAIDMDGTCLTSRATVTERCRRAVRVLLEAGVLVVPATGRGFTNARDELLRVPEIRYGISANGAVLTDARAGERLWSCLIARESAVRVIEAFWSSGTVVYAQEDDPGETHFWGCANTDPVVLARINRGRPLQMLEEGRIFLDDLAERVAAGTELVHKVGVMFGLPWTMPRAQELVAERAPELACYQVGPSMIELAARGASKAKALRVLCRHLGIALEDACAIGDNGNDLMMLREVGWGMAMANAAPFVREAADGVAPYDNDHDGAA